MDSNSEFIKKTVDDGTYFLMAKHWYNDMFLRPVRSAALMTALFLSLIALTAAALYNLYSIFPVSKDANVVIFLNDTINFYAQLTNISEEKKSTKQVVAEYLCSKYIKAREEYSSKTYASNYYFVANCSSKAVFDPYYSLMDTKNPQSPLILYKDTSRVNVSILSQSTNQQDDLVTIRFHKNIYNSDGSLKSQSTFEATMSFYMSDYDWTKSTRANLDFIVTKYDIKTITA